MLNTDYENKYKSTSLDNTDGSWGDFNQTLGSVVETFLKNKLEKAVVDLEYNFGSEEDEDNMQMLLGKNAFGEVVCKTKIINANPTYTGVLNFSELRVGSTSYNEDITKIQINKSGDLNVIAKFSYIVTGNLAGNDYNETSVQTITFNWYDDQNCTIKNGTLPSLSANITPGEEITWDISSMFEYAFTGKYLGIQYSPMNTGNLVAPFRSTNSPTITLKALQLSYNGKYLLRSNVVTKLNLTGLDSNESANNYYYSYKLNSDQPVITNVSATDNENLSLPLPNLKEGINNLFIRVQDTDDKPNLTSNDIQISFIYQKTEESELNQALAVVTAIPNQIYNCDTAKLFEVTTTDKKQGNIRIVVLKSNKLGNIINLNTIEEAISSDYVFKDISLTLNASDPSQELIYNTYVEVQSEVSDYLRVITSNGTASTISQFYIRGIDSIQTIQYKEITVVNPVNGISHLTATTGSILNFSQINNGNLFTDLNPELDESDGIQLETENNTSLTVFKASPTSQVFREPKELLNSGNVPLNKDAFSIEMVIKTYNCNDINDEILSIGNIKLCPKHLYVYRKGEETAEKETEPTLIKNASRADFAKNKKQHIIITFDPNYKPNTYTHIYDQLYSEGDINYSNSAQNYPCLKIYVDGVINRAIRLAGEELQNETGFKLQIHPKASNINFYVFRTYDKALSYEEIKQNHISQLLTLSEKESFYAYNNILYNESDFNISELNNKRHLLNTISLGKCINKFKSVGNPNTTYSNKRVLLLALPEGVKPPYYGNRKEEESVATFLVHYPNDKVHSGRLYPQDISEGKGVVKAQGSSAKKYMIHNTSYSKFYFVSEEEWDKETPTSVKYYKMPDDDITEIKKLVGKVNYASSMQSHKQGATKLFHDAYMSTKVDKSWMNGGRKAVLEDDFLYFYVNVPIEDLTTLTWDYFKQEDGTYNFENCYFLGFQTWGSAKGDEATSGYGDNTPYYLMLEGADNANAAANFKVPWAAMQCWEDPNNAESNFLQHTGKDSQGNPDYLTGLLINDETIVYNPGSEQENSTDKRADAWDVDFGCTEGDNYYEKGDNVDDIDGENLVFSFEEKAKISLNRFAEFYNYIYKYDFSSLVFIPNGSTIDVTDSHATVVNNQGTVLFSCENYNKLVFGDDCSVSDNGVITNVNPGDIYRWEKGWASDVIGTNVPSSKWVPAGLYYNSGKWDTLNIYAVCNEYTLAKNNFFANEDYNGLRTSVGGKFVYFGKTHTHTKYSDNWYKDLVKTMAEAFKIIVYEYTDIDDIAYHQAFIRLISGTDNRAKNTYFQIVGPISPSDDYEINEQNLRNDFKIRLYADDLDTIFKTDNNGQQIKPYYLLEPPFDKDLQYLWGDLHSGFFYNLDLVCENEIKIKLGDLLDYSVGNNWPDNQQTNIYKCFLNIQKNIPSIAYNHHSEIYYESAETLFQDGEPTNFYDQLAKINNKSWKDFSNNQVYNPLSLSHGSCYDAEVEHLKDRLLMLSSYVNKGKPNSDSSINLAGGSQESGEQKYSFSINYVSFIQYWYPQFAGRQISKEISHLNYDPIIDELYSDKLNLVYDLNVPNRTSDLNIEFEQSGLTTGIKWESTDLYKTIQIIEGTEQLTDLFNFPNASTVICQDSNFNINKGQAFEIKASNYLKSVEHLILQNANIQALGLNFQDCNRLKTLVLGKTINDKTDDIEPTKDSVYYALKIQDVLNPNNYITLDQGESCSGFNQLILPNSNSLEYIVIPNCVKTLNIGYYPNLQEIKFDEGTLLTNLVIDGRNDSSIINEIIYNYLSTNSILYITNIPEEGIWLSEDVCRILANINNVNLSGKIIIGKNNVQTDINYTTKKLLVEKFGNIADVNNSVHFVYQSTDVNKISTSATATIQSSGNVPVNLQITGNKIPIIKVNNNYYLNIEYKLLNSNRESVSSDDISINKHTGYLTIAEGHTGEYIITTTVVYGNTSKTLETALIVGFYTPKVGDFAYSNGTFSSVYDNSLNLVGIVYYVDANTNDEFTIRVLSDESITGYPVGPCNAAITTNDGWNTTDTLQQSNYQGFVNSLGITSDFYNDIEHNTISGGSFTITHDYPVAQLISQVSVNSKENVMQREYIKRVNNYAGLIDNYVNRTWTDMSTETLLESDKNKYMDLYNVLKGTDSIKIDVNTYENVGSFTYGLYPAIINTLYFKPDNLSDKGVDYYNIGKWYVPTVADISLILYHRINSSRTDNVDTHLDWNATSSKQSNAVFKPDAYNQIALLKTSSSHLIASECNDNGVCYYYSPNPNNYNNIQWSNSYLYWYNLQWSMRTYSQTIYPCCCVTLKKS